MERPDILARKCLPGHADRIAALCNPAVTEFVARYAELCDPAAIFVRTDAAGDAAYIRAKTVENGEETALGVPGHTIHFDGYNDLARDVKNTKFLLTPDMNLGSQLNSTDRAEGLAEITGLMEKSMAGREMYVLFLCLGPVGSDFSIYAVQLTDSAYVAHSEDILYRPAYEAFRSAGASLHFFKYVHSAGELDERKTSRRMDKKRVYVDFLDNIVYSVNTQYAGNTVGLKKLSLRLAIRKAWREKWLAEHMFIMRVGSRDTFFLGAFPSMCGKTSTCMVRGEKIVGDDIAYLRKVDGKIRAVNVERGIFGIIENVNEADDPLIWKAITKPGEVIFSNVLLSGGMPWWKGDGRATPSSGENASGPWRAGKTEPDGTTIPPSHPNARYTLRLDALENCDPVLEDPAGVPVDGIIYGGRDSDTWPPVFESFNWEHGVVTVGASLESETTAATLGTAGVRKFNIMANIEFLSITVGDYVRSHLDFAAGAAPLPRIFGVNYFLRDETGGFLTDKHAKRVWLKWMERRVHGDAKALRTPIGFIPVYEDLRDLFAEVLGQDYTRADYDRQFSIRTVENLAKIGRIEAVYRDAADTPLQVFTVLEGQRKRLLDAQSSLGAVIPPARFS